ncbi:MAG: YlxR family protein, partial [Dehalococcoidia bacterium]
MTGSQKRPKHVPERTCIACREKRPKWELVRVVRTPQGGVEIDPRGKEGGRGAYLCRRQECWEIGLKGKRLQHALRSEIVSEQCAEFIAYSKALP